MKGSWVSLSSLTRKGGGKCALFWSRSYRMVGSQDGCGRKHRVFQTRVERDGAGQGCPGVSAAQAPTRVRYWVIVFAVSLAVVTYIDRVSISFAAPFISRDLGLDSRQMGWAFTAFGWAYALFEIPGGYLGDRLGPRSVLTR